MNTSLSNVESLPISYLARKELILSVKSISWTFCLLCLSAIVKGQEPPTWSSQIACLVYSHCSPCHNDEGIAPFALLSYEDAFAHRFAMEAAISTHRMPPWPPSRKDQHIQGNRSLTEEEVALFQKWVQQGAVQGDKMLEPEAPINTSIVEIEDPDISIRLPDYVVPDLKELDLYRCFVLMTNQNEDTYIEGVEILPGNRSIVHHVILYQDTSAIPIQLDATDPEVGYTCFGGVGSNSAAMVAGWVPGSGATFTPDGMGIFLPKGARLIAQLHYPEGTAGQIDSTRINVKFSNRTDLRNIESLPVLNHFFGMDRPLFIPANTRQTFHQTFPPIPFPVTLTGIAPHAHLICESMKAYLTTAQGDTIPLIDIPHWDFEWQGFYSFIKPIVVPAFSTFHGVATYNNTSSNHHLPTEVPVDVSLGEATTDEMMLFFMSVSLYQPGDEEMIFDTTPHQMHHLNCSVRPMTTSSLIHQSNLEIILSPNPAKDRLYLKFQHQKASVFRFEIIDVLGQIVHVVPLASDQVHQIPLPLNLPNGTYYGRIASMDQQSTPNKFLILR
ncbi:MAG: T9SS type A sorting domain-containing protein [Saprospiraceae bacterium]|nr:T9SS type A sorting domain-containing protein [Saprospiraceae bacterium]